MNKLFIVAGEPSADMHGGALAFQLKDQDPNLRIIGIGGPQMKQAKVEIFADITNYAVVGFLEVLKNIRIFQKTFALILKKIQEEAPQAIVLIDFPGFNLRLAQKIKKDFPQLKIIYYISPQVWAWGGKRVKLIKKIVDKMLVIFEFEKSLYEKEGIAVEFVGHPLLDIVKSTKEKETLLNELGFRPQEKIIGLLPGSREVEVKRILPVMLKGAFLLAKKNPGIKFMLMQAANIKPEFIRSFLQKYPQLEVKVISRNIYDYLNLCSLAWVCSGTATLETALLGIPLLITYKTSFFTWLVSKCLIKLPYIGLVNIVAGEMIVPEFIQYQAKPLNLVKFSEDFFGGNIKQDILKQKLEIVRQKLGTKEVNKKAAQAILEVIN